MAGPEWQGRSSGSSDWAKWKLQKDLANRLGRTDPWLRAAARSGLETQRVRLAFLYAIGSLHNEKKRRAKAIKISRDPEKAHLLREDYRPPVDDEGEIIHPIKIKGRSPKIPEMVLKELQLMDLAGASIRVGRYSEVAQMNLADAGGQDPAAGADPGSHLQRKAKRPRIKMEDPPVRQEQPEP